MESTGEKENREHEDGVSVSSLVPTDVIQQVLTLTLMSLHILSHAKFLLLYLTGCECERGQD